MKEAAIKKLGFTREDVSAEESGDDNFYYYVYKAGTVDFISNANTDITARDKWCVEMLECGVEFHILKELKIVIELMELNIKV
jgi:hypothetical protein